MITRSRQVIFAFSSLLTLFGLLSVEAFGCTCGGPSSVEYNLASATVVFSGRITSKTKSDAIEENGVKVIFKVNKVWKGKVGKKIDIYSGPTDDLYDHYDLCSPKFRVGERYVVFATGDKLLSNMVCSYTTLIKNNAEKPVVHELGRSYPPAKNRSSQ